MRKVWLTVVLMPALFALFLALALTSCGYDCSEDEFDRISSESEFNEWMDACADKVG